jgi:hypothetical protein
MQKNSLTKEKKIDELMDLVLKPVASSNEGKERNLQINKTIEEIGGKEGFYEHLKMKHSNTDRVKEYCSYGVYIRLLIIWLTGLLWIFFSYK